MKLVKNLVLNLPIKDVMWLKSSRRQKQYEGTVCSTRKKKPIYRYTDETHLTEEYKKC